MKFNSELPSLPVLSSADISKKKKIDKKMKSLSPSVSYSSSSPNFSSSSSSSDSWREISVKDIPMENIHGQMYSSALSSSLSFVKNSGDLNERFRNLELMVKSNTISIYRDINQMTRNITMLKDMEILREKEKVKERLKEREKEKEEISNETLKSEVLLLLSQLKQKLILGVSGNQIETVDVVTEKVKKIVI
jgi:hypothetical protein